MYHYLFMIRVGDNHWTICAPHNVLDGAIGSLCFGQLHNYKLIDIMKTHQWIRNIPAWRTLRAQAVLSWGAIPVHGQQRESSRVQSLGASHPRSGTVPSHQQSHSEAARPSLSRRWTLFIIPLESSYPEQSSITTWTVTASAKTSKVVIKWGCLAKWCIILIHLLTSSTSSSKVPSSTSIHWKTLSPLTSPCRETSY